MVKQKIKIYQSPESYRKFLAYIHMRTPKGKLAKKKSETISAKTPRRKKEKVVKIKVNGYKLHKPKLS
jgi:hypothetical protein